MYSSGSEFKFKTEIQSQGDRRVADTLTLVLLAAVIVSLGARLIRDLVSSINHNKLSIPYVHVLAIC